MHSSVLLLSDCLVGSMLAGFRGIQIRHCGGGLYSIQGRGRRCTVLGCVPGACIRKKIKSWECVWIKNSNTIREGTLFICTTPKGGIPGQRGLKDQKGPIIRLVLSGELDPSSNPVVLRSSPKGFQKLDGGMVAPQTGRRHQVEEESFNRVLPGIVCPALCACDEER